MPSGRKSYDARLALTPQPSLAGSRSAILPLPGKSEFPSSPALSSSLLQLELSLAACVVDLQGITNIIRSDIGLTAQLLRLAASELEESPPPLTAVSEIILHLGVDKLRVLVTRTEPLQGHSAYHARSCACLRFWMHSRLTAMIAEELAAQSCEIHPEEAYLAGLLFHLGDLPLLMGWIPGSKAADARHTGYAVAKAWRLPRTLLEVIAADHELCSRKSRVLLDIVLAADAWASRLRFLATRESAKIAQGSRLTH